MISHTLVSLVVTVVITVLMSVTPAADANTLCFNVQNVKDAPPRDSDATVVYCGMSKGSVNSTISTMMCSDSADNINSLMVTATGKSNILSDEICYLKFSDKQKCVNVDLSSEFFTEKLKLSPSGRVEMHSSVSLLFDINRRISIVGNMIRSLNPEVFEEVGESQKNTLKVLQISKTSLKSLDLTSLAYLNLTTLSLVDNKKLQQLLNWRKEQMNSITELILAGNHKDLMNCTNFMSLPSSVTNLTLIPDEGDDLTTACGLCQLPESTNQVTVPLNLASLPFYPSATKIIQAMPTFAFDYALQACQEKTTLSSTFSVRDTASVGCDKCECAGRKAGTQKTTAKPKKPHSGSSSNLHFSSSHFGILLMVSILPTISKFINWLF